MPPRVIAGRYTVERAIGHGGMGTVWLCRDDLLGRMVAVKQVGTLPDESTSDVNRALREARSSAALNHPNVVRIYDAIEDGDHNWLVMEYVQARTLAEILVEEGPLDPLRVARIAAQAADGLAAAHARGTMHRDVKPGNILVGADDHVKIMDFGISRTHGGDDRLTRSGLVMGTPAYFAPEIARGEEPGLPADVWALGATIYRAVEGRAPYPEQSNAIVLLNLIASESVPPPERAGVLTEPIGRMLDRDPVSRWSMADAAHVLHRLLEQQAGSAPQHTVAFAAPIPTAETVTPAATPDPTPEPVPVAAVEPEPTPVATPTRARPVPVTPRRRPGWLLPVLAALLLLGAIVAGALLLVDDGDDVTPTAGDGGTSTSTPDPADTASPDPTTDPSEPTTPPTEEESPSEEPTVEEPTEEVPPAEEGSTATDTGAFAEEYYGYLPSDTKSAYSLLSEGYRAGTSYGAYKGFWRTISAVSVSGTEAVDDTTVDVALTYTSADGAVEDEVRRLYLEDTGDGYLIASDEAVG